MDVQKLQASAQRIGVSADPRAARPFRLAAVRLSDEDPDTDAHRAAATEAASLLVGLALAEAEDDLRRLLTPDPAATEVIWTVACYQIGDLTPSAIRDFPNPVDAIATVAACPEEMHVAAELVASTAQGLRWTAVLRTNDLLSFQLPSADTASDASRERPGDLSAALKRWRERLADWSAHAGHERDTESVGFAQLGELEVVHAATPPSVVSSMLPAAAPAATSVAFNERFSAVEQRLAGIEESLAKLSRGIENFSGNIEQVIDARFRTMGSLVHSAVSDLEYNLGQRVDKAAQRVTTTVSDSAADNMNRIRNMRDPVAPMQPGITAALAEETAVVLTGLRAGLTPLTSEMVQRVSALERALDSGLAETTARLRDDMAVLFAAVASLRREHPEPSAQRAIDIRS